MERTTLIQEYYLLVVDEKGNIPHDRPPDERLSNLHRSKASRIDGSGKR